MVKNVKIKNFLSFSDIYVEEQQLIIQWEIIMNLSLQTNKWFLK